MDSSNSLPNHRLTVESRTLPSGRTQYMAHDLDTRDRFIVSESRAQEIMRNNEEREQHRIRLRRRFEEIRTSSNQLNANFDGDERQVNNSYTITTIQPRSEDESPLYLVNDLTTGRSFRTYSLENIEQQLEIFSGRMSPTIDSNDAESEVSRRRIGTIANANYEEFTNPFGNLEQIQEPSDNLYQLSYETLVKRLYGLPFDMPEFLIVNGLKLNFIPFSQVSSLQIERYIIAPLLQPWAGSPSTQNRILTIFPPV